MKKLAVALSIAAAMVIAGGCGGGSEESPPADPLAGFDESVRSATESEPGDFPAARGRSVEQLATELKAEVEIGLATSGLLWGRDRLAFGLIDSESGFVYGPTAVYIAESPKAPARGPFPAPADPLVTEPEFRSEQAASDEDRFAAIYEAQVPVGRWKSAVVLSVTQIDAGGYVGAGARLNVIEPGEDSVTEVGEPAPEVETDTVASAGDISAIETRTPPDQLHETDFADVVGEKPVALLFATPALCESRVCGPVVDIAQQLEREYGDRMEFIHQEVFVDNDPAKGLRPPLKEFGLQTEPWLFVVDSEGEVTARLEGSFGIGAFTRAVESGL